jgi:hypothetical protein
MASDSGSVTSGDTGKAKLTGQGYTMAGIRAEGDETMFDTCDRHCLDVILTICKTSAESEIKDLKLSDIDSKFSRDTSDNLLVKTQGLLNLYQCDIPREIANSVVNLFNDANSVTKLQEKVFGKQVSSRGAQTSQTETDGEDPIDGTTPPKDKVAEQNNIVRKAEEKDDQGN